VRGTAVKDSFERTKLQDVCVRASEELLKEAGATGQGFKMTVGRRTSFYEASFQVGGHHVEIFIYPDEAEFSIDGQWSQFETPDFDGERELAAAFAASLSSSLRRLVSAQE
jgi:hypothetical protein